MTDTVAERVYESLTTQQLHEMRAAFLLDKAAGAESEFCEDRLRIIALILAKRNYPPAK